MKITKKDSDGQWNLKHLYSSDTDENIERDIISIEKACNLFAKKYRTKDFVSSVDTLLPALRESEKITEMVMINNPLTYFELRTLADSDNAFVVQQSSLINHRLTKALNTIQFFTLALAKIEKKNQKIFLNSLVLVEYSYMLQQIFNTAQYNLSESEETLLSLLTDTSREKWIEYRERLISMQTIDWQDEKIPLTKAESMLSSQTKSVRRKLYTSIQKCYRDNAVAAEAEINAVYSYKKIIDEKRGFEKPYTQTVLEYENDKETVESFIDTITKNFSISKGFYKIHKELLRETKPLSFADRSTAIGKISKKFSFPESCDIVRSAFSDVGQEYADYLDIFLTNGQIDIYPRVAKASGAYCCSTGGRETYILLNHTDSVRSAETLAHEMGHAIHTEMSKSQKPIYQGYTTSVAEVASLFFEQVLFGKLQETLSEKDQKILLHNKIMGDISSIFRQTAFFNFELELHTRVRETGYVSHSDISKMMKKHLHAYAGDAFEFSDLDGYFFVDLWHIRRHFYVYSYAMGQIISRSLYENWKKDPSYIKKIEVFLSSGCSQSPRDIFKKTGIDIASPIFYQTALDAIVSDIKRLKKMK
jgi:oligoendopeptidase F